LTLSKLSVMSIKIHLCQNILIGNKKWHFFRIKFCDIKSSCWKRLIIECGTIRTHELRAFCVQNETMSNCCIGLCCERRHVFWNEFCV